MTSTATKIEVEDFESREDRAELIDGQIIYKAQAGYEHGNIQRSIGRFVSDFHRKKRGDGVGGWWFATEATIQYRKISEKGRQLIADIAGWRRDKHSVEPKGYPIEVTPDWVCEICHSTRKKDTTIVPETLAAEGVEWYWFVDVESELLTVFHLENERFSVIKTWKKADGKVRIPPFDAVELSVPVLFGDDPEE